MRVPAFWSWQRILLFALARGALVEHPRVILEDINIVVTTDLHSWIEGRGTHQPTLNASIGHVVSFVNHLKAVGRQAKRDVFFFDNGDINDGTGLSAFAEDHVAYLGPLLQRVPYDALNIGNHELYTRNGDGDVGGPACPIVGLQESGYIAGWQGRYLTSNVIWANTTEPVGSRFAQVEGEFGTKLLVLGFLYNMDDHCNAVEVQSVAKVVRSEWFVRALADHAAASDAIVVLAHMDYRDELVDVILQAIRANVGGEKPVQFLTGHSHIRGWRRLDRFASSYEAGCKLDTVGFTAFATAPTRGRLEFRYADVDGSVAALARAANVSGGALLTPSGRSLIRSMARTQETLGLGSVLGCSDRHYRVNAELGRADSLWTYYMGTIVPGVLFEPAGPSRPQWSLVGTGALTYDIFPGAFTIDDAYKASPYGNFWYIARHVEAATLAALLRGLNIRRGYWGLPLYVNSSTPEPGIVYDLIFCDFDALAVEEGLAKLTGGPVPAREVYRPESNTSSVLVDWFRQQQCVSPGTVRTIFA